MKDVDVSFNLLKIDLPKQKAVIRLTVTDINAKAVSVNSYPIKIATKNWATQSKDKPFEIVVLGVNDEVKNTISAMGNILDKPLRKLKAKADVIVLGPTATSFTEKEVQKALKPGGRLLVLEQGKFAHRFCEDVIQVVDTKSATSKPHLEDFMYDSGIIGAQTVDGIKGKFVEMLGWKKNLLLFNGLDAMDWKWWSRGGNKPAYVASASHKIDLKNKNVIPIGRYLELHFYFSGNLQKVYDAKIGFSVFAVKEIWGDVVVCDLTISDAVKYDPRAGKTLANLIREPFTKKGFFKLLFSFISQPINKP